MSFTQEHFDKAWAEFRQLGPRRRIPLEKRWQEILPEVKASEYAALHAQCKELESFSAGLARRVGEKELSDDAAKKQIAQKYPSLTQEQIKSVWSYAIYLSVY